MGIPGVTRQVLELHQSSKLRILAVTSSKRLVAAPDLPTASESGYSQLTVRGSIGFLAPAGTPRAVIEQIADATHAVVVEPSWQQMLIDAGIEPIVDSDPEKFRRSLAADVALWSPVVKTLGIKVD